MNVCKKLFPPKFVKVSFLFPPNLLIPFQRVYMHGRHPLVSHAGENDFAQVCYFISMSAVCFVSSLVRLVRVVGVHLSVLFLDHSTFFLRDLFVSQSVFLNLRALHCKIVIGLSRLESDQSRSLELKIRLNFIIEVFCLQKLIMEAVS